MTANTLGTQVSSPSTAAAGLAPSSPPEPRKTFGYKLVLWIWMLYMFEPQTFIANYFHIPIVAKLLLALTCLLLLMLLLRPPRGAFLVPYAAIAVYLFAISPFAVNTGYARIPAIQAVLLYVFALGVATFVRTPKQLLPLLGAFMVGQFIWWGLWGVKNGVISWEGEYVNSDGFGPLMGLGVAAAFPYGVATRNRGTRFIAFGAGLLCVLGLVSSFARGAFLAGVAVLGWLWLNAPRKGLATGFLAAAAVAVIAGAGMFTSEGRDSMAASNYFDEIATIFTKEKTGDDNTNGRSVLWDAAVKVWKANPLTGVGGRNFGVYVASHFTPGEAGGEFALNPGRMYTAAIHNIFLQILSEEGLIGLGLYLWLLVDFFRRNQRLRSPAFRTAWLARGGGALDLKWLSVGVASMMIAILSNGFFYNVLYVTWLPAVIVMNALLYKLAKPAPAVPDQFAYR